MKVAILTSSDRCATGSAQDESGPAIAALCTERGWLVEAADVVPDDASEISAAIRRYVDTLGVDLVLTTGGTGLGPRDITPEATLAVLDRPAPGIAEALRIHSLKTTPFAMLSRGVSGLRGKTLIINLPGSPKAVRECMEQLVTVLPHAVAIAGGAKHS